MGAELYAIEELVPPTIEALGLGWRVRFLVPDVTFDIEGIKDRWGDLSANLTVTKNDEAGRIDDDGHLLHCSLRLRNLSDRNTVFTGLSKAMPHVEWRTLLDRAVYLVLQRESAGNPAILLRDSVQPPESGFILPPLALGRQPSIIFGDGGCGKSWLLLAAAISIQTGQREPLGLTPSIATNVLYLDWELDDWEHRERMRLLVGANMPGIVYQRLHRPLAQEVDNVRQLIAQRSIGFLCIDSAGFASDGPPEEAQAALGFYRALRQLDRGALISAHINRSGDTERPFGSTFWHNGARQTWYAKASSEHAGDRLTVGLYSKKANLSRSGLPMGFTFTFDTDRVSIRKADVRDVPELATAVSVKLRIAHFLRTGPKTYAEIADELEVAQDTVKTVVNREIRADRYFVKVGPDGPKSQVALRANEPEQFRNNGTTVPMGGTEQRGVYKTLVPVTQGVGV